jgi:hypothetical protein
VICCTYKTWLLQNVQMSTGGDVECRFFFFVTKSTTTSIVLLRQRLLHVLDMPHATLSNNPQLMFPKHNVHRVIPIAAHPDRPQRPPRLRINDIHNLAPSPENQPAGTRPNTVVKVLQRTTDQTAIGENRQLLPGSGESEIPCPKITGPAEIPARGFDGAVGGACVG